MFERDRGPGSEGDGATAFLGKGTRITGKLQLDGPGRIEGHVEGEIGAQDTLIIGESAVVNASVTGTTVVVQGQVTGDIRARTRLEIRSPGQVRGTIETPSLVIAEGAVFEGQCSMSGTDAAARDHRSTSTGVPPPVSDPAP